MKNRIFSVIGFIFLIIAFLIIQAYFIMYNIQVKSVTDGGIMLSVFGQDFVYEYNIEE